MTRKIILGPTSYCELSSNPIDFLKRNGFEVIKNPYGRKLTKKELLGLLDDEVEGIIAGLEIIDKEIVDSSKIRVVSRVGSGTDNLDLEYLKQKSIEVYTTPEAPVQAVAEITLGSLLALLRKINNMDSDLRSGIWKKKIGYELKSKTIFIIGFGRIGQRFAKLLNAFDCNILFHDPYINLDNLHVSKFKNVKFEDGIRQADIISLHVNGTEEIIKKEHFDLMKKGVFILNPARGELINEKILKTYLDNGTVDGVWLDTYANEPYSGELIYSEKCILTPHAGSYSRECRLDMEMQAAKNLINFLVK